MTTDKDKQPIGVFTPDEHRKLYRWAKTFLLVSIVCSAFGILHNIHARFDPEVNKRWGHVTHVHIGGRDLTVPNDYIRGPAPTEANAKQLDIWLTLPNYAPYQGDYVESQNLVPIGYRHIMVLVDDTAFTTDLAFRYNAYRNGPMSLYQPRDIADMDGLQRSLIYRSPKAEEAALEQAARLDRSLIYRSTKGEPFIWTDLFFAADKTNKVTTFIDCDPDTRGQNPMCSHFFQDGRLIYQLTYSKSNLGRWREIQAHVHGLVDSFSCIPTTNHSTIISQGAKQCPL